MYYAHEVEVNEIAKLKLIFFVKLAYYNLVQIFKLYHISNFENSRSKI